MAPALEMRGVVKRYPGVLALDSVAIVLEPGSVHCLVGENGAGKSTLVKILSGGLQRDAGIIRIGGRETLLGSPGVSRSLGIGIIHQDFRLVPELSVAENILLGDEPTKGNSLFIDKRSLHSRARAVLDQLGLDIDTSVAITALGVAQRQMVEIAKAISRRVRILAMDEPTAALSEHEITILFKVIRQLKSEGVAILYISHRLEEVFEIGDMVSVLRDGKVVQACDLSGVDRSMLIRWMVGRELEAEYPKAAFVRGREILRVENLHAGRLRNISFSLHEGEILGLAGLVGAGRSELARVLFGADPRDKGTVVLDGRYIAPVSPRDAIDAGIALLTENRNELGLVLQMSVRENISLSSLDDMATGPFVQKRSELETTRRYIEQLHIRPPAAEASVEELSGGNRQKVVLARWLNTKARVLIFDEPTAGIDVGARYEIYTVLNEVVQKGIGVIIISSELPELLGMCDRIVVMCEGSIAGVLDRDEATQERLLTMATGGA